MGKKTRREFLEDSMLASAAAVVPIGSTSSMFLPQTGASVGGRVRTGDPIRIAVIGVRGRGGAHVGAFKKSKDSKVVAICDADEGVIASVMKAVPDAKYYKDIRKLLENRDIDAVSIAMPNHWHSLAAKWALEAGKHVYVEKPISHNVYEGRRVVQIAAKSKLIVQHGTQARSQPATRDAIQWMVEGGLGKVKLARALCYKRRGSIGKVKGPQEPPKSMDYDLWTGPAEMQPLLRKKVHYDWHWVFNTGNGDMGNQGVHQMDIARWGLNRMELPEQVFSCGGRLGYDDDGNTPNTQVSVFDYGDQQLIFEVRGLKTGGYGPTKCSIGVVFHCEDGYLVSQSYGRLQAFDLDGKVIKTFKGGKNHFQNFLDAVKANDPKILNATALDGHLSASLCHLGNISYLCGEARTLDATDTPFGEEKAANESFARFRQHLGDNGLADQARYSLGPVLRFDPKQELFVGEHAQEANILCSRKYRGEFVV